ncbi:hypothetical protein [Saliphagus sp. LR7]|uniref:hypothetical protein n=1 Tax=Saliphagus sp. LR7 TaxID=2282654 RepID=UPI0013005362|nr:hypothetical protein [Saliphagus sp. LR7]
MDREQPDAYDLPGHGRPGGIDDPIQDAEYGDVQGGPDRQETPLGGRQMTDPDTRILQAYVPNRGERRAVAFEPRNAGGWDRITYEYRRGAWIPTGSEIVAQLEVATGDDVDRVLDRGRRGPPRIGP